MGRLLSSIPLWLWIAMGLAFVARLLVAWSPVLYSLGFSVPDDAYYYFTIARNLASGQGVTFDGLMPTNGFHPLWLVAITPIWWLVGWSDTLPVHLALTLGALLDVVTMIGIWRLAVQITQRRLVAGLAVVAYGWNYYSLAASVNGLETSLSAMLFVWSLGLYWEMRLVDRPPWQSWLKLGLLWALLLLARTDYLIVLLPCALDLVWRQRRNWRYFPVAAVGALLFLPWFAWNQVTFGSLSQVSSEAYPYYLHQVWHAEGHTQAEWLAVEGRMAYGVVANLARFSGFDKGLILLAIAAACLLVVAFRAGGGTGDRRRDAPIWQDRRRLLGLLWPTMGGVALVLIHGLVRWMYVPWYFVPGIIVLVLWFAIVLDWLAGRDIRLAGVVMTIFLIVQLVHAVEMVVEGGMWPHGRQIAAAKVPELVAKCEELYGTQVVYESSGAVDSCACFTTLGSSDSGFNGYFLPCRVINLDGVVNNQAFLAIQEGRFREYLDETGIEYAMLNDLIRRVVAIKEGSVPETPPFAEQSP